MNAEAAISPVLSKFARTTAVTAAAKELDRTRIKMEKEDVLFCLMRGIRPRYNVREVLKSEPNASRILLSRFSEEISATHGRAMA